MFTVKIDHEIELELFQAHHSEELFRMVDTNREHLREWLPWVDSMVSLEQYHTLIPQWLHQFANNNGFHCGIRYQGKLVGTIGAHHIDWRNSQTSLGYYLIKSAEGKGIMTRSVQGLLNYIFYDLNLNRVEIRCGEKNIKSQAIPERLGFKKEGIIRDAEQLYGRFHHLVVYGMLAREWKTI